MKINRRTFIEYSAMTLAGYLASGFETVASGSHCVDSGSCFLSGMYLSVHGEPRGVVQLEQTKDFKTWGSFTSLPLDAYGNGYVSLGLAAHTGHFFRAYSIYPPSASVELKMHHCKCD